MEDQVSRELRGGGGEGTGKMASEGDLGRKWDRCLADSAVKLGKGSTGMTEREDLGKSGAGPPGSPDLGEQPPACPRGAGPTVPRCPRFAS